MKLYFSGLGGAPRDIVKYAVENIPNIRALVSFYYKNQLDRLREFSVTSLFLDSGAYSAMNSDATINLDDYIAYCREVEDEMDAMASLDVIGDHEGSIANYLKMREAGLDIWPTYHFGEPLDVLDNYAFYTDHICVGGVAGAGVHRDSISRNLGWIFGKYPKLRIHVFGVNSFDVLMNYPVYSVDALTWRSGSRFGDVFVRGRRYKVGRTSGPRDNLYLEVADWLLENAGLDVRDPEFNWTDLDLWNLRYLHQMLEIDHSKRDFSTLVASKVLF